ENKEDEALSRPIKNKKIEHVTTNDFYLVETEENNDDLKRKQVDGLEVITGAINQLNNELCSGTLSLELLGNSSIYMKNWYHHEYKLYGLSTIACSFALPLLSRLFEGWDPLIKPADNVVNQLRAHTYYVGIERPHGLLALSVDPILQIV
nr:hypothetical protein [Tanacetum cinerariifolium]